MNNMAYETKFEYSFDTINRVLQEVVYPYTSAEEVRICNLETGKYNYFRVTTSNYIGYYIVKNYRTRLHFIMDHIEKAAYANILHKYRTTSIAYMPFGARDYIETLYQAVYNRIIKSLPELDPEYSSCKRSDILLALKECIERAFRMNGNNE